MFEVKVPFMDVSIENIHISDWYYKDGDFVEKGELILTFESDKATFDFEAEATGFLKILVPPRLKVTPNQVIAVLFPGKEDYEKSNLELYTEKKEEVSSISSIQFTNKAKEMFELNKLSHSDLPAGKKIIRENDILSILEARQSSQKHILVRHRIEKITKIQHKISMAVQSSLRNTAQTFMFIKVPVGPLIDTLEKKLKKEKVLITSNDAIIMLLGKTLTEHPLLNAYMDGEDVIFYEEINIAVAIFTPNGLYTPVIKNVDKLDLLDISRETKNLNMKAIRNQLSIQDLIGGTFTVTNLGSNEVHSFIGILNERQSGIISIGAIHDEYYPGTPQNQFHKVITLALTYDHRLVNGFQAASFLQDLKKKIESVQID